MPGKSVLRPFLLLLALALLSGCGFQLRGKITLPAAIGPVHIQGLGEYDEVRRELVQLIRFNNIQIADQREQASSILRISDRSSDRRVLSVDGNGNVAEYELHEGARFSLLAKDGATLVESQPVSTLTTYLNSETEVLGKQQEEGQLRKDMQRDLAAQIMRRLQAQL
ncbi:MAG: LPS assembly lipoprotein LptE [Sedimenticola sp.]|nr:LPS assembly lipoprotein LptE [Sedimenticola sp.]